MLQTLKNRRADARDDQGFTLIELMVVVLIIAILLAIAIPTFLGAQNKAKDRAAQTAVKTTLTAAGASYADASTFGADTAALVATLTSSEPNLTFQAGASTGPKVVSVHWISTNEYAAVAESATNTCFAVRAKLLGAGAGTFYGKPAQVGGNCVLDDATSAAVNNTDPSAGW